MPLFTLNAAATACHRSKSVLLNAIKTGRLSATRNDKNQWQIDSSELDRVYPYTIEQSVTGSQNQNRTAEVELLEQLLEQVKAERDYLKELVEDVRVERDGWRNQATMLLTHQPEPKAEQPTGSRLYDKLFKRKYTPNG